MTSALDNDPELRAMQIDVQTQDGVVRLSGFVDSMAQVDRAGELARRVDGVSGVRNSIRVTARPRAHERRAWLIALTRRSAGAPGR